MIDAGHSVAVRWIANPFLDAYRELMDRFPALWVLEPSFPSHLREFLVALEREDEATAISALRAYYERVDSRILVALAPAIATRDRTPGAKSTPEGG